jgi:hypothetical protein
MHSRVRRHSQCYRTRTRQPWPAVPGAASPRAPQCDSARIATSTYAARRADDSRRSHPTRQARRHREKPPDRRRPVRFDNGREASPRLRKTTSDAVVRKRQGRRHASEPVQRIGSPHVRRTRATAAAAPTGGLACRPIQRSRQGNDPTAPGLAGVSDRG